jgi:hypothetical protein
MAAVLAAMMLVLQRLHRRQRGQRRIAAEDPTTASIRYHDPRIAHETSRRGGR